MENIQFHIEFPQITALQPFLMLADPPLTRHVTIARQSCTVFTNNSGKRPTLLLSALAAVFGKSARVSFASDHSEEQSMLNHNSQSWLFSFLQFPHNTDKISIQTFFNWSLRLSNYL